jgi:hypothetical protein
MTRCPGHKTDWAPAPFGYIHVARQLHPKCKECSRYVPGSSELMPAMRMGECPNYFTGVELANKMSLC